MKDFLEFVNENIVPTGESFGGNKYKVDKVHSVHLHQDEPSNIFHHSEAMMAEPYKNFSDNHQPKTTTGEAATTMRSYIAGSHHLNSFLSNPSSRPDLPRESVKEKLAHIDSLMVPLKHGIVTYTGIGSNRRDAYGKAVSSHPDQLFTSKAYTSTSASPHVTTIFANTHSTSDPYPYSSYGEMGHIVRLTIPKGHKVIFADRYHDSSTEKEVVLPRHTLLKHNHTEIHHTVSGNGSRRKYYVHDATVIHPDDYHKYGHDPKDEF